MPHLNSGVKDREESCVTKPVSQLDVFHTGACKPLLKASDGKKCIATNRAAGTPESLGLAC
jgi:hypothetical protein